MKDEKHLNSIERLLEKIAYGIEKKTNAGKSATGKFRWKKDSRCKNGLKALFSTKKKVKEIALT